MRWSWDQAARRPSFPCRRLFLTVLLPHTFGAVFYFVEINRRQGYLFHTRNARKGLLFIHILRHRPVFGPSSPELAAVLPFIRAEYENCASPPRLDREEIS